MGFWDFVKIFLTNICDLTFFLQLASFAFAAILLAWPKRYDKRSVIALIAEFLGIYALSFLLALIAFPLDRMFLANTGGLLFTFSFFVSPILFIIFFTNGKAKHKALKSVVLVTSMALCIAMSRDFGILVGKWSSDSFVLVVIARIVPILFIIPMAYLFHKFDISVYHNLPFPLLLIIYIVSVILFGATIWENKLNLKVETDESLLLLFSILYMGLMLVSGLLYYSIYRVIWSRHQLTVAEVQATLSNAEKEAVALDARNREELAKMRHDLKNQFSYLGRLLEDGKTEDAKAFLAELGATKAEALDSFSCPNRVVSSIINLEINKAKLKNIKIKTKVVVPPNLKIDEVDLVSLITNVVDNAIENSAPNGPEIGLSIITYQDYLRISCTNVFPAEALSGAQTLHSRKIGKRHGYGTKIIRNVAETYGGYADFSVEDNTFIADVVLMLTDKEGAANA